MNRFVPLLGWATIGAIIAFAGCGTDAVDASASPDAGDDAAPTPAKMFAVSGTVSGLAGTGLVLQNNGGDDVVVTADGAFSFPKPLSDEAAYAITVKSQPTNRSQTCTVANGTGAVTRANVTNVTVTCTTNKFTVGGTVTGAVGAGLVLTNNGGGDLAVATNGAFVFPTAQDDGSDFVVAVKSSPPEQNCVVSGGTGKIAGGNVTSITVNCSVKTYAVGGTISGLEGTGLVLQNNAGDDLTVNANGTFAFAAPLVKDAAYDVTLKTNPTNKWQTCTIANGSGTVASAPVTNVEVTCVTNKYKVKGSVSGLAGTGLVLQNNAGDDLGVSADGSFELATSVASGGAFNVSVLTNPSGLSQTCTVANGTGVIAGEDVTTVAVTCTTNTYAVSGSVTGMGASTGLVLQNNAGDDLTVNADGTFTFPTKVTSGGAYAVTVKTPPGALFCSVANGTGTVTNADIGNVAVTCEPCGNDCWGPGGCMTDGGKCIKFSCRAGNAGADFCNTCMGWKEITYDQWMNGGYCGDIIAKYRASNGSETKCGSNVATCCGTSASCAGGDNAWHFSDGVDTHYVGPCLGCNNDTNCGYWNGLATDTSYTRITACIRQ